MNPKESARRRFLKNGAALAGLAAGAMRSARGKALEVPYEGLDKIDQPYGGRSRFDRIARMVEKEYGAGRSASLVTPIQHLRGIITPGPLHYVQNHGYFPPDIDPDKHRLMIHGLVDRPLIFTLDDLGYLPSVSRIHFLECGGNSNPKTKHTAKTVQETHGRTSCSEWTGVLMSTLLEEVGVQKAASWIVVESADRVYTKSIPLAKALDDVLLAYGQNGEPVRPENGYPLRMVVPGWEGMANVKYVTRIKLVDGPYMDRWETTVQPSPRPDGKSRWFQFEQGPISVVTRPSGGHQLTGPGFYEITGLAWSGAGAIRRVEVSTDGGRNYKDAQLQEPVLRKAHTRWRFNWKWDGEEAVLQSRCTDETGTVQPTVEEVAKVWNVSLEYLRTKDKGEDMSAKHFNAIWPWKVTRDGSIHNALLT